MKQPDPRPHLIVAFLFATILFMFFVAETGLFPLGKTLLQAVTCYGISFLLVGLLMAAEV